MAEEKDTTPYCDPPGFDLSVQGHEFEFHPCGNERLGALIDLIDSAQESLQACYYTFADEEAGHSVRDALVRALQRGVKVTLIVDGFGTNPTTALFGPIEEAGGKVLIFSQRIRRRYLIRNHQKMAIADCKRAVVGGFNVADAYFAPPEENGWNDMGVTVEGPVVDDLCRWFAQLERWASDKRARWRTVRRMVRDWEPGKGKVRLLVGGPVRGLNTWVRTLKADLENCSRLDLMMAYFTPSPSLVLRLGRIARKGDTRLLLAAKSDNGATIGASRLLYSSLLEKGAEIWEFSPCKLHAKLLVLDDVVYFGSANFDMRSLFLNLELMIRVEDAELAARLREYIAQACEVSEHITLAEHRKRATWWNRLRWAMSWFLVAVLDYTVTRRLNFGLK